MLITVEQLQRKLNWKQVQEERRTCEVEGQTYHDVVIHVVPDTDSFPTIDFVFNDKITCLHCIGLDDWHTHCDSYNDERRNVVRAIQIARGLINHQECLIEELDENDRYLGSCVQRQTEPLNTLSARARRLRYVFFNEEPHIKAIDYSAYVQVKGGYWILKSAKQKIEEMHRQLGNKSPFE